ncbi:MULTISPECIES: phytoene/squalene synthase family protein [Corynebacterium]|nr:MULTISPECIES: phytoene/squalene synthase family protein [Corynebacterium]
MRTHQQPPAGRLYTAMASRSAAQVIAAYSTSFSLATHLLDAQTRQDIRNLYAVVRIADEIVDGAAATGASGQAQAQKAALLDAYEQRVLNAPAQHFHTDPVLHAYADTARRCHLEPEHMHAFFASMRMDIRTTEHSPESLQRYIYGSAEVIGLMCLAIFLRGQHRSTAELRQLRAGAQALGSAFQKINFLRDLGDDYAHLGRLYFPAATQSGEATAHSGHALTDAMKSHIVEEIRGEVRLASEAIDLLPLRPQMAVRAATDLFATLLEDINATPAATLPHTRVSVSTPRKAGIALRATATTLRRWRPHRRTP